MTIADKKTEMTRRSFLSRVIGACVAFVAAVLGVPAIGAAIGPAFRRTDPRWFDLGPVESFPVGEPTPVQFGVTRRDGWIETTDMKAVWVVRQSAGDFIVFNGRCTHLGCAYRWEPDKNQFSCPCHAGFFSKGGEVVAGPPPRPLDPLSAKVEGASLQVQYVDFRLGVPERVPA